MNAYVRPAKHTFVAIDEIDLSHTIRPYNASVVGELAQSIRAIGLQTPLTCILRNGQHILVAGRNRLEALRLSRFRLANQRIGFLRFAACADSQGVWHGGKVSGYGER